MPYRKTLDLRSPPACCIDCQLRRQALFTQSTRETIETVQSVRAGTRMHRHGGTIYREGDPIVDAYTLYDGYAFRYRLLPNGGRQIIQFVLPGDLLFEHSVQRDGLRTDTAEVVGGAVVCVLPVRALNAMFEREIEIAQSIALIREADEAILSEHITDLGRRPAIERLARLLLELFWRQHLLGRAPKARCHLPFTQDQIGDAIGLTAVHVSRVHQRLREDRLMSMDSRWLRIPDFDRAAELFDFSPGYIYPRPLI